jgi:hypothetical protein
VAGGSELVVADDDDDVVATDAITTSLKVMLCKKQN